MTQKLFLTGPGTDAHPILNPKPNPNSYPNLNLFTCIAFQSISFLSTIQYKTSVMHVKLLNKWYMLSKKLTKK